MKICVNIKASLSKGSGNVEIRTGSPTGKIIGIIKIKASSEAEQAISCKLDNVKGIKDIYLKFNINKKSKAALDWISFSK